MSLISVELQAPRNVATADVNGSPQGVVRKTSRSGLRNTRIAFVTDYTVSLAWKNGTVNRCAKVEDIAEIICEEESRRVGLRMLNRPYSVMSSKDTKVYERCTGAALSSRPLSLGEQWESVLVLIPDGSRVKKGPMLYHTVEEAEAAAHALSRENERPSEGSTEAAECKSSTSQCIRSTCHDVGPSVSPAVTQTPQRNPLQAPPLNSRRHSASSFGAPSLQAHRGSRDAATNGTFSDPTVQDGSRTFPDQDSTCTPVSAGASKRQRQISAQTPLDDHYFDQGELDKEELLGRRGSSSAQFTPRVVYSIRQSRLSSGAKRGMSSSTTTEDLRYASVKQQQLEGHVVSAFKELPSSVKARLHEYQRRRGSRSAASLKDEMEFVRDTLECEKQEAEPNSPYAAEVTTMNDQVCSLITRWDRLQTHREELQVPPVV